MSADGTTVAYTVTGRSIGSFVAVLPRSPGPIGWGCVAGSDVAQVVEVEGGTGTAAGTSYRRMVLPCAATFDWAMSPAGVGSPLPIRVAADYHLRAGEPSMRPAMLDPTTGSVMSPRGTAPPSNLRYAVRIENTAASVVDSATGSTVALATSDLRSLGYSGIFGSRVSPDGKVATLSLVSSNGYAIALYDVTSGSRTILTGIVTEDPYLFVTDMSADGRFLALSEFRRGTVTPCLSACAVALRYDRLTSTYEVVSERVPGHPADHVGQLSDDGMTFAFSRGNVDNAVYVVNMRTGAVESVRQVEHRFCQLQRPASAADRQCGQLGSMGCD